MTANINYYTPIRNWHRHFRTEVTSMKGIVTVLGKDSVGILTKICAFMSERNVSVMDIAQTIVDGYFIMMMIVDLSAASEPLVTMSSGLETLGLDIGVIARIQHEDIFNTMHRI